MGRTGRNRAKRKAAGKKKVSLSRKLLAARRAHKRAKNKRQGRW